MKKHQEIPLNIEEFNIIFNKVQKIYGYDALIYTDVDFNTYIYFLKTFIDFNKDNSIINNEKVIFVGKKYDDILKKLDNILRIEKLKRLLE